MPPLKRQQLSTAIPRFQRGNDHTSKVIAGVLEEELFFSRIEASGATPGHVGLDRHDGDPAAHERARDEAPLLHRPREHVPETSHQMFHADLPAA